MKNVQIRSFYGPNIPVFGLNTGKYGPEKLRIWTHSTELAQLIVSLFIIKLH